MNYKRLLAATAIAGLLAATGCSANIPERNQGNRNGQRVADAVNRRDDSYGGRTTRGLFGNRYSRTPNRSNTFGRPQNRVGSNFRRDNTTGAAMNNTHTMNRTERGISANRATRRANTRAADRMDGISRANPETAAVFFNKTKTAPEQEAPQNEQAPAPVQ